MKQPMVRLLGLLMAACSLVAWPALGQDRLPQTISWTGTTNAYLAFNQPHSIAATASSGLPVSVSVVTGPAVLENGTLTVTNHGTVWLRAEQAGNGEFASASVERSFNVRVTTFAEVGKITVPAGIYPRYLDVVGKLAYVPDGMAGLVVYNIEDTSRPFQIGAFANGMDAKYVQVNGTLAYVAGWPIVNGPTPGPGTFTILDISDPTRPRFLGGYELDFNLSRLAVEGDHAFLPAGAKGLMVLNLKDPTHPVLSAVCDTPGWAQTVCVENGFAYVADNDGGLQVIDVRDPAAPKVVGSEPVSGYAYDVQLMGGYAYVSMGGWQPGLRIIDVSDPTRPKTRGFAPQPGSADRLETAAGYENVVLQGGGLRVLDVSNAAAPLVTGGLQLSFGSVGLKLAGDLAFLSEYTDVHIFKMRRGYENPLGFNPPSEAAVTNRSLSLPQTSGNGSNVVYSVQEGPGRIEGDRLVFTGVGSIRLRAGQPDDGLFQPVQAEWKIKIVKAPMPVAWSGNTNGVLALHQAYPVGAVSSNGLPVPVKVLAGPAVIANGMITVTNQGTVWLAADEWNNPDYFPVLDTRKVNLRMATLTEVGHLDTPGYALKVQVEGVIGHVADADSGVQLINIKDPSNPVRMGTAFHGGNARDLRVRGNVVFVADGPKGLQIFDVRDPANPVWLSQIPTGTNAVAIELAGNFAYVADMASGLQIVDVSDPSRPTWVGGLWPESPPTDVAVSGDWVYLACGPFGWTVIDASDRAHPQRLANIWTNTRVKELAVVGDRAYLSEEASQSGVFDLSDPRRPRRVSIAGSGGLSSGVCASGGFLWHFYGAMEVWDIGNPDDMIRIAYKGTRGQAGDAWVSGDYVFVADGLAGVTIFKMDFKYENHLAFFPQWYQPATNRFLVLPQTSTSGDPVTYSVSSGPAKLEGDRLVYTGAGLVSLKYDQADNGTTIPAKGELSITITQSAQSITWHGTTNQLVRANAPHPLSATASSGLPVALRVLGGPAVLTNGILVVTGEGPVQVAAEQPGNLDYAPVSETRSFNYEAVDFSRVGFLSLGDASPFRVQVSDGLAFLQTGAGVLIVDVRDPATPQRVGVIRTMFGNETRLAVAEGMAFVTDGLRALQIWSVKVPAYPARLGGIEMRGTITDVVVRDGLAYVSMNGVGLDVVDVRDPSNPRLEGSVDLGGEFGPITLVNQRAYFPNPTGFLKVIDISQPKSPVLLSPILVGESSFVYGGLGRLQVQGTLGYLNRGSYGVEVFDLSKPNLLSKVGGYESTEFQTIRLGGSLLFGIGGFLGKLEALDVSNPRFPESTGHYSVNDYIRDLDVVGDHVYLANSSSLTVVKVTSHYPNSFNFNPPSEISITNRSFALPEVAGNGRPILYTVLEGPGRIEGGRLVYTGGGEIRLRGAQDDDGVNFTESGEWSIRVNLVPQTLSWGTSANDLLRRGIAYALPTASSGLPVTLTVESGPAVVANGAITVTNVGTVWVTAEQKGGGDYAPVGETRSYNTPHAMLSQVGAYAGIHDARGVRLKGIHAFVADGVEGLVVLEVSDPAKPTRIGGLATGGMAGGIELAGDLAYVAAGEAGLRVVDVRDPARPELVGTFVTSGPAAVARVVGNLAYVALREAGLEIVDVSAPNKPVRVGGLDTSGLALGVEVQGNLAFVADWLGGVKVVDVGDPAHPALIGEVATASGAVAARGAGNVVAVAENWAGLRLVDVSSPAQPVRLGGVVGLGDAYGLALHDGVAFVAGNEAGLSVVEVGNALRPTLLGRFDTPGQAIGVEVAGEFAYVADGSGGLQVLRARIGYTNQFDFNPSATLAVTNGFIALPQKSGSGQAVVYSVVSGPAKIEGDRLVPTGAGLVRLRASQEDDGFFFPVAAEWQFQVERLNQTITWTGSTNEFFELNVPYPLGAVASSGLPVTVSVQSGPAVLAGGSITVTNYGQVKLVATQAGDGIFNPVSSVRALNLPRLYLWPTSPPVGHFDLYALQVVGHYAYVGGTDGFHVFDVSDPTRPVVVAGYEADVFQTCLGVRVTGNLAYLAFQSLGLRVLDVSDPTRPVEVGASEPMSWLFATDVMGGYAYGASLFAGLRVFDLSNAAKPMLVAELPTESTPHGVLVRGGHAYVADYFSGLEVYDLVDPAKPLLAGRFLQGGQASGVRLVGNLAYLANGSEGLQIIDVEDPKNLTLVGACRTLDSANAVRVVGNLAFVADQLGGVQCIDVGDPANPVRFEANRISGQLRDLEVDGHLLYTLNGGVGMQVYEWYLGYPNSLEYTPPADLWVTNQIIGLPQFSSNGKQVQYVVRSGPAKVEGDRLVPTGEGEVRLRLTQEYDGVFLPVRNEWTIQVHRLPQSVAWRGTSEEILSLNQSYELAGEATSGLPVTVRLVSGPAVLAEGRITVTGEGTVVVRAEQGGNAVYQPAAVTRAFNVRRAQFSFLDNYYPGGTSYRVAVAGSLAYLSAGAAGLQVIDVSQPTELKRVGGLDTTSLVLDFKVAGGRAYMAEYENGLQVLDLANPIAPARVGGLASKGQVVMSQLAGNAAYVANGWEGLLMLDLSDPARPAQVGGFNTDGVAQCVEVVGDVAYLADDWNGLQIVDVSHPANPVKLGGYPWIKHAMEVRVDRGHAFIAARDEGLIVFDVRNPADPVRVATVAVTAPVNGLEVAGDYVFAACGWQGVRVFDVSEIAAPVEVGGYTTSDARSLLVQGNRLYLADTSSGLVVFDVRMAYASTLELGISLTSSRLEVVWPENLAGVQLQSAGSLAPGAVWQDVTGPFLAIGGQIRWAVTQSSGQQFFRLMRR